MRSLAQSEERHPFYCSGELRRRRKEREGVKKPREREICFSGRNDKQTLEKERSKKRRYFGRAEGSRIRPIPNKNEKLE